MQILYQILFHYFSKMFLVFWRLDCNYEETDCAIQRHTLKIAHGCSVIVFIWPTRGANLSADPIVPAIARFLTYLNRTRVYQAHMN